MFSGYRFWDKNSPLCQHIHNIIGHGDINKSVFFLITNNRAELCINQNEMKEPHVSHMPRTLLSSEWNEPEPNPDSWGSSGRPSIEDRLNKGIC